MKSLIVLFVAITLCHALYEEEKFKQLDVDAILADEKQIKTFINCFSEANLCNQKTQPFRADFIDAIQTACRECTPLQSNILKRFLASAGQKTPNEVQALIKQFDPQNQYFPALRTALVNA